MEELLTWSHQNEDSYVRWTVESKEVGLSKTRKGKDPETILTR